MAAVADLIEQAIFVLFGFQGAAAGDSKRFSLAAQTVLAT